VTINTIDVPFLDDYVAKVVAAGGTIVFPKMAVPGVGYLAYGRDTEGVIFGMMQSDPSAA
jgi:predicted enzyme related to lactoylglutathione lyase